MKDYKRLTFKRLVDSYDDNCEETENATTATYEELLTRLATLEDKIENRTLIELPCQKGDQIWYVNDQRHPPRIEEWIVVGFAITEEPGKNWIYESRVIAICSRFRKHTDWCHNEPTELYLDVKDICLTEEEAKEKFEKLYGWIKGNKPMTHGCDKEYCFYPEICETNRVCLECKYCIYANLIKEEIDKKNED